MMNRRFWNWTEFHSLPPFRLFTHFPSGFFSPFILAAIWIATLIEANWINGNPWKSSNKRNHKAHNVNWEFIRIDNAMDCDKNIVRFPSFDTLDSIDFAWPVLSGWQKRPHYSFFSPRHEITKKPCAWRKKKYVNRDLCPPFIITNRWNNCIGALEVKNACSQLLTFASKWRISIVG